MRIAYYISNRTTFPPAGNEIAASSTVVINLIKHLSGKHDITVYAAQGSAFPGVKIVDLGLAPYRADSNIVGTDWATKAAIGMKQIYIGRLFADAANFDLIHLHTEPSYLAVPYAGLIRTPVLFTIHNEYHSNEATIFSHYEDGAYFSGISKRQVAMIPFKKAPPVVYNGIETDSLPFSEQGDGYFLFLGRLVADKGIDTFLELAKSHPEHRFVIAGKGSPEFERKIAEQAASDGNLRFEGMVPYQSGQWRELISKAKALVMPIRFEEPFGLNFVESMAMGTPVVAFSRGAVPEVIEDGKTGYVINPEDHDSRGEFTVKQTGLAGLQEAIRMLSALSPDGYRQMRLASRRRVEENFTAQIMAARYDELYRSIVDDYKARTG